MTMNPNLLYAILSMDVYNRPGSEPNLVKLKLPDAVLTAAIACFA